MSNAREQFVETTCLLLEEQGYHATGVQQIITESGGPKGSLYYYFPDGKEGLTAEAIRLAGQRTAERITRSLAQVEEPGEAVRRFLHIIADRIEESDFRTGGPLATVAMETATTNERLNLVCREAYQLLLDAFTLKFTASGFDDERAAELATFVTSGIEGAVILCRTWHSGDPLRRTAEEFGRYISTQAN